MLTHLLIRLRWLLAACVAMAVAAMVCNHWWHLAIGVPVPFGSAYVYGGLFRGDLWWDSVALANGETIAPKLYVGDEWPQLNSVSLTGSSSSGWLMNLGGGQHFPFWVLAALMTIVASVGFAMKQHQSAPGQCKACHYPLSGATTCPECGRAVA